MTDADEDYYLPLQDQRVFGAGIKRKRINFIPASSPDYSQTTAVREKPDIAARYLSIVLPNSRSESPSTTTSEVSTPPREGTLSEEQHSSPSLGLCPICSQPLSTPSTHESSLTHQVCLTHVHPPSHLPRSHVGLRYLTNHGWDPDSRKGLGAAQQGIVIPIKAKEKKDTAGLSERVDQDAGPARKTTERNRRNGKDHVVKLNSKELKVRDVEAKKRAERLRANFYGPDLEKYLGPDAAMPG